MIQAMSRALRARRGRRLSKAQQALVAEYLADIQARAADYAGVGQGAEDE